MVKPYSNSQPKEKDKISSFSETIEDKKNTKNSKSLIIGGFIISITSIFLLTLTIYNQFG